MPLSQNRRRAANQARAERWRDIPESHFAQLPLTREHLKELQALHLDGHLVMPWDPDYDEDRKLSNPAFDKHPWMIAYCESMRDVATILRLASGALSGTKLPMVIRSGGHSAAGYSAIDAGVVLDLSRLSAVHVDPRHNLIHAGPGSEFRMFWEKLDAYGLVVPAGVCPDVCVGGYMQGGGYGWLSRNFGMNCDTVLEVEVMLADGSLVVANETTNRDLFWAIRGGTGNNFGVLLRATYQAQTLKYAHGWALSWDVSSDQGAANGAVALDLMQRRYMGSNADRRLGMMIVVCYQATQPDLSDSKPYLLFRGMFLGSRAEGLAALRPLLETPGATIQWDRPGTIKDLNDALDNDPQEIPQFPAGVDILPESKQSRFTGRPLGVDGWRWQIDYIRSSARQLNVFSTLALEVCGGAINALPRSANAYVHRDSDANLFLDVFWRADQPEEHRRALDYLREWVRVTEPLSNGEVYQNYPNEDLDHWWTRYWPVVWPLLPRIKSKYDPGTLFDFPQGVAHIPQPDDPAAMHEALEAVDVDVARSVEQPIVGLPRP